MASATVTLKVSPQELQILNEALRWYEHALKYWRVVNKPEFKANAGAFDNDPRKGVIIAQKLQNQIGLK